MTNAEIYIEICLFVGKFINYGGIFMELLIVGIHAKTSRALLKTPKNAIKSLNSRPSPIYVSLCFV
jgi:hypothetical protein